MQLLWRSLLNVPEQDRDAQLLSKKPSSTTGTELKAGSLAAPNPTFRTVSSSFCLLSLATCSSFICRSSSSCSASSFWRSSFRFWRASLWGGGLPARSRFTVVWMAARDSKRAPVKGNAKLSGQTLGMNPQHLWCCAVCWVGDLMCF